MVDGAAEAAGAGAVAADTVAAAVCVIPDAPELPVTAEATVEVTGWSGEETAAAVPSWAFVPDGSRVAAWACRENKTRTIRMPAAINAASIALRAMCRDAASDTTCSRFCRQGKQTGQLPPSCCLKHLSWRLSLLARDFQDVAARAAGRPTAAESPAIGMITRLG